MKFNSRKVALWLTVTMLLSFTVAASIATSPEFQKTGFNINWGDNSSENGIIINSSGDSASIDQKTSADATGINNLNIIMVSEDMTVVLSEDNTIKAHLVGNSSNNVKLTLIEERNGNEIKIYVKRSPEIDLNAGMFHNLKMEVSIPKTYGADINVKTVSGSILLPEMKAGKLTIETVSGKITSAVSPASLTMASVSGEADLKNLMGSLKINTISGNVNASFSAMNNSSIIGESVSGSMTITLPLSSDFDVDFKSVSGELENSMGTNPNSQNKIKFNSVSGNLSITK